MQTIEITMDEYQRLQSADQLIQHRAKINCINNSERRVLQASLWQMDVLTHCKRFKVFQRNAE